MSKKNINMAFAQPRVDLADLWDQAGKPEVAKCLRDNRAEMDKTGHARGTAARSLAALQMFMGGK